MADLRKVVVDYFLSLPESGDYSLRESFATLMKHSVRTQQKYYDERPLAQKKERALDLLSSVASQSLVEVKTKMNLRLKVMKTRKGNLTAYRSREILWPWSQPILPKTFWKFLWLRY